MVGALGVNQARLFTLTLFLGASLAGLGPEETQHQWPDRDQHQLVSREALPQDLDAVAQRGPSASC
jgi:hypothetical protein